MNFSSFFPGGNKTKTRAEISKLLASRSFFPLNSTPHPHGLCDTLFLPIGNAQAMPKTRMHK